MNMVELMSKSAVQKDRVIEVRKKLQKMNGFEFEITMLRQVEGFLSWIETHGHIIKK